MIEITDNPDKKRWGEFVYNHPHGNIFQTPEMAEVYKRTKNHEPITLAAIDTKSDMIIALVNAVVIKEFSGILGKFTARSIIQGGPLFIDNENTKEAVKVLMEHYDAAARKKAIYTQIRNMWEQNSTSHIFETAGYDYVEHLNFLINLNRPVDAIWRDIHKSRRKGINRAESAGIIIDTVKDKKDFQKIYNIIHATYKKVGFPLADISLLESAFEVMVSSNKAQFYVAKHDDRYVGARIVLNFKGLIYDWYAGALSNYAYVNEALVWFILREGATKGYTTFDFGGAGSPHQEYGVREFKRRFGGEQVNFGRYEKVHSISKQIFLKNMFKIYKSIK